MLLNNQSASRRVLEFLDFRLDFGTRTLRDGKEVKSICQLWLVAKLDHCKLIVVKSIFVAPLRCW